jgi:thiol-disulfide isomerase/thioredoxin
MPALKTIKKLDKLVNIEVRPTPYSLKTSKLSLLNIRTNKMDTIPLYGITLINFWASWCKPCIEEEPSLEDLKSNNNVNILLLSFDSLISQRKIISDQKWNLPAYFVRDTSVFNTPDILPMSYIIKDSTVLEIVYGKRNWSDSSINKYK